MRAPTAAIHRCTTLATNSGPWSERMWPSTPPQEEPIAQHVEDVVRGERAPDPDGQALAAELVPHVEPAEGSAVPGPVMHEVVRPDVVHPLGTEPDTGAVTEPESVPFPGLGRYLQPLAPPQALDPLVVDPPAGVAQQGRDAAVAVADLPASQLDPVRN